MQEAAIFLTPWEFSPFVFVLCVGAVALYARGLAHTSPDERPGVGRRIAFFAGWGLIYFVMQTHYDYLSQHVFFVHRVQHLVLHHLGPFLVALAQPLAVLARGLPPNVVAKLVVPVWRHPIIRAVYRLFQNAVVAPLLFVGLIYLWLTPSVHFDAMLSARYYAAMNWSMLLDGLLFWSLVLDPRTKAEGARVGLGARIWVVLLAIPPQIAIGAYIAMSRKDLFDVYAVCGRAWPISPATDQHLGGFITWMPASMMHAIAALIVLSRWMRADARRAGLASCAHT
ncbi:MAG: cytochrome c oxidase assembly protein [Candidatus Babeliaceae bacterium]